MKKKITTIFLLLCFLGFTTIDLFAQSVTVRGKVVDERTESPLAGVNVVVKGKVVGTISNPDGSFSLTVEGGFPLTLVFSFVGYRSVEKDVTEANATNLIVELSDQVLLGKEVVVSASRTEENIMESPVSIEKMNIMDIRNSPSDDYYKAIASLRGVDVSSSSINFQILNTRGFGSTGNERFVQLTDMMDTQAPALNFPIGNLNGPSLLDVESVELIPGAASALYGANAYNGILLVTSKNPFEYQGLSAYAKFGMNHFGADTERGAPDNPQPLYEASIRYAKAFSDKFAFKVNVSYMKAEDWYGTNYENKNNPGLGGIQQNPAYDGVHKYGDDGGINLGLLRANQTLVTNISQLLQASFGLTSEQAAQSAPFYVGSLPAENVNRTGYEERYLVDYGAENLKVGAGLHYRITDNLEASYTLNYGYGTSVYTGAQRYSLKNFNIQQHKLELEADNFVLRGYTTIENSGDSYIADFSGFAINNAYLDNTTWFGTYAAGFIAALATGVAQGTGSAEYNSTVVNAILSDPANRLQFHNFGRNQADINRWEPGSPEFNQAFETINSSVIPQGSRFDDKTRFYQIDGNYNFKNQIDAFELLVGGQWRKFDLRSNGTIFPDNEGGGIQIDEYGAYFQVGKSILDEKLKLQGSLRYDKSKNFDGQLSPRISAVVTPDPDHAFRASYQTGFRNPSTQGQYIDLNVVTSRLLGGLQQNADKYDILNNTYEIFSVMEFTNDFLANQAPNFGLLERFDFWEPVKPEKIQVFEVGYRGVIDERLMVDLNYYYNIYDDFITQVRVRQVQDAEGNPIPINAAPTAFLSLLNGTADNTFSIYTNVNQTVKSQGAALGLEYLLPREYRIGGNYSWNKLDEESLPDNYLNDYNTPEHIINLSFSNRKVVDNFGFNIGWRYQTEFEWQSSFGIGTIPSYNSLDLQVSYTVPSLKSVIKLGGSNVFNNYYIANYGSPSIGAIYYVSVTFDEMLR